MGFFSSGKSSSTPSGDQKASSSPGFFGDKKEISRREFREKMAKTSGRIPGAGGASYTKRERVEYEKKLPWGKYGANISKKELGMGRIKELQKEKYLAKTWDEKNKIDREIRYLKDLTK